MNYRAVLAGVCGVLLLSDASQSAAPQQNPTTQDAPLPRASSFLFDGSKLIQPLSKEERDARLREIRAQYRASEAQKVRIIAEEMRIDAATEQQLIDLSLEGLMDIAEPGEVVADSSNHGLGLARSIANRYDNMVADIQRLLGEGTWQRYQWCVAHLAELQAVKAFELRLPLDAQLTANQRAQLVRLLKAQSEEELDAVDEDFANGTTATPGGYAYRETAAQRAKAVRDAAEFLSPTQLRVLLREEDGELASPTVQFAPDPASRSQFDLPTEPQPLYEPAALLEIAVQLDDGEPIVMTQQPVAGSPLDIALPGDLTARLWVTANRGPMSSVNPTVYSHANGTRERLRSLGTFGSLSHEASITIAVIAGAERAHILLVSLRPIR